MRLVVSEFITLDGVVQAPGGPEEDTEGGFTHGGWSMQFFDPEVMGPIIDAGLQRAEALLFGRRTYQTMAAAWPERAGDPFADRMNEIPKYVVSETLTQDEVTWSNSTLLPSGDELAAIQELRQRDGGDLSVMGSSKLVQTLFSRGMVDELLLMIEPTTVGGGKTIFPKDGQSRVFDLVSAETTNTGVILARYRIR